ncbi:hypothetical protein [Rubritalea tangerina]
MLYVLLEISHCRVLIQITQCRRDSLENHFLVLSLISCDAFTKSVD